MLKGRKGSLLGPRGGQTQIFPFLIQRQWHGEHVLSSCLWWFCHPSLPYVLLDLDPKFFCHIWKSGCDRVVLAWLLLEMDVACVLWQLKNSLNECLCPSMQKGARSAAQCLTCSKCKEYRPPHFGIRSRDSKWELCFSNSSFSSPLPDGGLKPRCIHPVGLHLRPGIRMPAHTHIQDDIHRECCECMVIVMQCNATQCNAA